MRERGTRIPRRCELGPKGQHREHPRGRDLLEEERQHLQGGRISPLQIFPGAVHHSFLRFFHDPRYQGFLHPLPLLLWAQPQRWNILWLRQQEQRRQEWECISLGKLIGREQLLEPSEFDLWCLLPLKL